MKVKFLTVLAMSASLLLPAAGCGGKGSSASIPPRQVDPISDPQVLDPSTPVEQKCLRTSSNEPSEGLSINIVDESTLTTVQQQKLAQTVAALEEVLNSAALKQKILDFTFQGKKQFNDNNGLSNEQIYETLMAGAEVFPTKSPANHLADISVVVYSQPWWKITNAVAYSASDDALLNIDNRYFNEASIPDLAKTIIHEWVHKLGFFHDDDATANRPYSVPYGIGSLVGDAVAEYLNNS